MVQIKDFCFVSKLILLMRPKRYIYLVYLNIHRMENCYTSKLEIITQPSFIIYSIYILCRLTSEKN